MFVWVFFPVFWGQKWQMRPPPPAVPDVALHLVGEDLELGRNPVGLRDAGLLFVLTVGFGRSGSVLGRLYAEVAVGLV